MDPGGWGRTFRGRWSGFECRREAGGSPRVRNERRRVHFGRDPGRGPGRVRSQDFGEEVGECMRRGSGASELW